MAASAAHEILPPPLKDPTIMNPAASADHKAERFYSAARLCRGPDSVVKFQDGSTWHEQELYVKAIELNPSFAPAYHNLALTLEQPGDKISVNGTEWDKQLLYIVAIEHDPHFAPSYVNLALELGPEDRIMLGAGRSLDRCSLLLQAIHVDPTCAMAYLNLGLLLPQGATAQLPNGSVVGAPTLIATAQRLDPTCRPPAAPGASNPATPQRASQGTSLLSSWSTVSPAKVVQPIATPVTSGSLGSGSIQPVSQRLPSLLGGSVGLTSNAKVTPTVLSGTVGAVPLQSVGTLGIGQGQK